MARRTFVLMLAVAVLTLFWAGLASADAVSVEVVGTDGLRFNPATISVAKGDEVTVTFENHGVLDHTFTIDELGIDMRLGAGENATVTFTASEPGQFGYYCDIAGHREAGMEGTLKVEGGPTPSTPGFEAVVVIGALLGAALILGRRARAS